MKIFELYHKTNLFAKYYKLVVDMCFLCYNSVMKNTSYFVERNQNNIIRLRENLKQLPDFCYDFFVGIETTTSPLTRLNYCYDLKLFFDFLIKETNLFRNKTILDLEVTDLEKVKASHIERFLSYISHYQTEDKKTYSNGERGKARKLSTLKTFFKYFFKKEILPSNVASMVDMPKIHTKPIVKLEIDEVAKLLTVVDEGALLTKHEKAYHRNTRERDVAIMTLMLGTGIRVSECVGLNINDIDFETNALKITRKGGNQDVLYFSDEVKEALFDYLDLRLENIQAKNNPALFLSLQNNRISVRAVQMLVKKYAGKTTPLKKITPHKLRTTYGTSLYRETQDIYIVADVLGHKDVNTTKKHYAAISEDLRRQVANKVKLRDDEEK